MCASGHSDPERILTYPERAEPDGVDLLVAAQVYARANLLHNKGGRHVQVAISEGDDPNGPYSPFEIIRIAGYDMFAGGNIYFANVNPNPIDTTTLLGLFPTALQEEGLLGLVGLSISCDGLYWAPLVELTQCLVSENRTLHHPVDGFVYQDGTVFAFVHEDVPKVRTHIPKSPMVVPYALDKQMLERMTRAAHRTLPGC